MSEPEPATGGRSSTPACSALAAAYVLYLASVVYLVWSPSPSATSAAVAATVALLARLGVGVSGILVEFGPNVLMLRIADCLAIDFFLSLGVEIVQRLLLPTRSGSSRNIVANTLGSLAGAVLLVVVLALGRARAGMVAVRHGSRRCCRPQRLSVGDPVRKVVAERDSPGAAASSFRTSRGRARAPDCRQSGP